MQTRQYSIGELASLTCCNVPTIRYYEQIGLIPVAERSMNGRRHYQETDLKRLTFIKRCRNFGFPVEQIKSLLVVFDDGDRSCNVVVDMAQAHLDSVRTKLEELQQLEANLAALVHKARSNCDYHSARDCKLIKDLSLVHSMHPGVPND